MRLAFFASYNGSSAKAITQACKDGILDATPVLLISNNPDCAAFQWANDAKIKTFCVNEKNLGGSEALDQEIANILEDHDINLGVCSGYMKLIGPKTIEAAGHILNIHPALLPKYGGQGMYGHHVHRAVKESGDTKTGPTVHLVNHAYDEGAILAQLELPVQESDTAEEIETRVKAAEPDFYIDTLRKILSGEITLPA